MLIIFIKDIAIYDMGKFGHKKLPDLPVLLWREEKHIDI